MTFGERLKTLLLERKVSQSAFAARLGITRARFNNYITNRSEADYGTLVAIADLLDVSTDYLLGRSEAVSRDAPVDSSSFPHFIPGAEEPGADGPNTEWVPLYFSCSQMLHTAGDIVPLGWLRTEPGRIVPAGYRRHYALLVDDDSMAPGLIRGDIAYIQPSFFTHSFLSNTPGNDVFAVRLSFCDSVGLALKRCHVRDNLLLCFADSSDFEPVILDMNAILFVPLVGKVTGVWRSNGTGAMLRAIAARQAG